MSREAFIETSFQKSSLKRIKEANEIMEDYARNGYDLTLRQLYYQFVSRDLIPNTQRSYKNLGNLISSARLAGLLDWDHMVDRTRALRGPTHEASPKEAIGYAAMMYREALWATQPHRIEVWVEKEALAGIIGGCAARLDIDSFACKGYSSSSAMYSAAKRLARYIADGQQVTILYLGDHDPSGLDMDRDIEDRLALMGASEVNVRRIALTWDQIQEYQPPPNPTKLTDSRAGQYIANYGYDSWELDALEPAVLETLIQEAVAEMRDADLYEEAKAQQKANQDRMHELSYRWKEVVEYLNI